jgi:hypothetical protein
MLATTDARPSDLIGLAAPQLHQPSPIKAIPIILSEASYPRLANVPVESFCTREWLVTSDAASCCLASRQASGLFIAEYSLPSVFHQQNASSLASTVWVSLPFLFMALGISGPLRWPQRLLVSPQTHPIQQPEPRPYRQECEDRSICHCRNIGLPRLLLYHIFGGVS